MTNTFTFDTCVGIKMIENKNFFILLSCRLNFVDSIIHVPIQSINEFESNKYDSDSIIELVKKLNNDNIITDYITDDVVNHASALRKKYPMLHSGDDIILACASLNSTTLITCDRDLITAANLAGIGTINPDFLITIHNDDKKHKLTSVMGKIIKKTHISSLVHMPRRRRLCNKKE